jgi:hypothetical protein
VETKRDESRKWGRETMRHDCVHTGKEEEKMIHVEAFVLHTWYSSARVELKHVVGGRQKMKER